MPISIGSNTPSLKAQRQLEQAHSALSTSYSRLSSGQRINSASDDAAGLAVADSLNVMGRVHTKALANLNDGISALSIADGAAGALTDVLIRIRELATQSANGTFSNVQRKSLDKEAQALVAEHDRIIQTTRFNGIALFDSQSTTLSLQAGFSNLDVSIGASAIVGTGDLQTSVLYNTGSGITRPYTEDFNNDGILDIAGFQTATGTLNVMLGNGNGTFTNTTSYYLGTGIGAARDFFDANNDGFIDVAARACYELFSRKLTAFTRSRIAKTMKCSPFKVSGRRS